MDTTTIIGIAASIGTGTSLLPQFFKLLKEKKAENVSIGMLAVLFSGLSLWVWYGFLKTDWIIIISNGFSLVINILTFILILRYKKTS
ncbi:MAG: SemiSWEET family transporter [Bacteroidia bacterium]|jgi:MtN3 and saliva related transmembrane protein